MTDRATGETDYFRTIEDAFIELRGSPFLLSPSDWRLAQSWYRDGIPIELVIGAIRTVFERRAERGAGRKVQSLRYCAAGVESAWRERLELGAPGAASESFTIDVADRLRALAAALPSDLPARGRWARSIRDAGDEARAVEQRLTALDDELMSACLQALGGDERAELAAEVEVSLATVGRRSAPEVLEDDRQRLLRDAVRSRFGVPLLSLFAPPPA